MTEDKDFGDLVFMERREHVGVVLLRLDGMARHEKAGRVLMVISVYAERLAGAFTVVSTRTVRVRLER